MGSGASAVPHEDVGRYFEFEADSPSMFMVAPVRPERRREMTTDEQALFGIDKLNMRGEPIVCTLEAALGCFMGGETEVLEAGNGLLLKEEQDRALKIDRNDDFEFDSAG